jgi:hypothetical protein
LRVWYPYVRVEGGEVSGEWRRRGVMEEEKIPKKTKEQEIIKGLTTLSRHLK